MGGHSETDSQISECAQHSGLVFFITGQWSGFSSCCAKASSLDAGDTVIVSN